jgi:hypothetical protein
VVGVPVIVGARFGGAVTVTENIGRDAVKEPSETLMTMLLYVRVCWLVGVPDNAPVVVLKLAQAGLLAIVNVRAEPSASAATGVKL